MHKKILAGLGGAIALNLVHEIIRKNFDNVPEVNKVGEEVLNKTLETIDLKITNQDQLYGVTLAGDVLSNGIYYATRALRLSFFALILLKKSSVSVLNGFLSQ